MKTLIFIFSLWVALPAWGTVSTVWQKTQGGISATACAFTAIGSSFCHWDSVSVEETDALFIGMCENVTVTFVDDSKNSAISGNTAKVHQHSAAASVTVPDNFNDTILIAGKTLTGDPGSESANLWGFDGKYITVDLDCDDATGVGVCSIQVQCHPRRS
jgi:hypothetical protein